MDRMEGMGGRALVGGGVVAGRVRRPALEVARERWPGITFEWARAHPAVTEAFLKEFLKQAERFPEVAGKLVNVSAVRFQGPHRDANGYAYPDGTQVIVNTPYARDPERAKDAPRLCRHEFGHQVLNSFQSGGRGRRTR